MKSKKGNLTLWFIFVIVALILVVITGLLAPMGAKIGIDVYQAGEQILLLANESIQDINNASIRAEIQGTIQSGLDATQTNIEVNTDLYKYGWIFLLVLTGLTLFIYARSLVETNRYLGGIV